MFLLFEIVEGDLALPSHAEALIKLLEEYAHDPMGGGEGLSTFAKSNLVAELKRRPTVYVVLAFAGTAPAGLIICFEAFSTFACRPLLNLHDVVVAANFRGRGLSTQMLNKVQEHAIKIGGCKLTLEVLEGNEPAQRAYRSFGFSNYQLDPSKGRAMFWEKKWQD